MKVCKIKVHSSSKYQPGRAISSPMQDNEDHTDHEIRCWRERVHADEKGVCYIPRHAFKKSFDTASRMLGKIPGKGNCTWLKPFMSGVRVRYHLSLGIEQSKVNGENLFVPSDGKVGGGKRVNKRFPTFSSWSGELECWILGDDITPSVFERAVALAGSNVGVGTWRLEKGGDNGGFIADEFTWSDAPDGALITDDEQ